MNNKKYNNIKSSIKLSSLAVIVLITTGCGGNSPTSSSETQQYVVHQHIKQIQPSSGQQHLWYKQPAKDWMSEALPIGNGYMGAMLFGGVNEDRIQFNEESLWAGGPGSRDGYKSGNRADAHKALPKIRDLVTQGKFDQAHTLAKKELTGEMVKKKETKDKKDNYFGDFGAYQAFADIYVSQDSTTEATDYTRALDLETGLVTVKYQDGTTHHKRQYFANYPSRVMAFRYENDASTGSDYSIRFDSLHPIQSSSENNTLILTGHVSDNDMAMEARLEVRIEGGELSFKDAQAQIIGTNAMTLVLTAATDYQDKAPEYKGNDYSKFNQQTLASVANKDYQALKTEHIKDYQSLYHRVSLTLNDTSSSNTVDANTGDLYAKTPTDQRISNYTDAANDVDLEALFFQYGRYLLISSSRPGSMPANIQGKWNDALNPAWASFRYPLNDFISFLIQQVYFFLLYLY